jgi:hypothetical protein
VLSNGNACREAVPGDWAIDTGVHSALSPDAATLALIANDAVSNWHDYVAHLKATYFTPLSSSGQIVLLENDKLFLMRETANGGKSHVLSLNGGATACGILLTIGEAYADQWAATGIQILYTLAETN